MLSRILTIGNSIFIFLVFHFFQSLESVDKYYIYDFKFQVLKNYVIRYLLHIHKNLKLYLQLVGNDNYIIIVIIIY